MPKTVLYLIDPEKYFDHVVGVIKNETVDRKVIYVTTNKPYGHLVNTLKKKNIKTDDIFFIDCISKHIGEGDPGADNCLALDGPQNLTSISIAVNESTKRLDGEKTILLDSLSVLLIYNDAATIGKFSNFIINKMRAKEVDTIVLALESDTDKDLIKQIESIVDEVKR